jgi:hypothetical protein
LLLSGPQHIIMPRPEAEEDFWNRGMGLKICNP